MRQDLFMRLATLNGHFTLDDFKEQIYNIKVLQACAKRLPFTYWDSQHQGDVCDCLCCNRTLACRCKFRVVRSCRRQLATVNMTSWLGEEPLEGSDAVPKAWHQLGWHQRRRTVGALELFGKDGI